MLVLISFLGGGMKPADGSGYREATYQFDDKTKDTSRYFAETLARKLQPDRVVMFGTSGSMWDVPH
ncbi:MAG: TM1812 family CRISPR-associated protein [Ghiorsea sp.]|nr:TM1812 family CRISPR-associated protein [Ghiorsea sp.]